MAFGRQVKLFVGNFEKGNKPTETALDLSNLDIDFEVTRSIEWYDNEATIKLYNPTADTLNMLMSEGNSVILQAGYEDQEVGNIFVGQIAQVVAKRQNLDIVVNMTCLAARGAFYQLARLHCSINFKKGTTLKECLQELCDYAQIVLRAGFKKELAIGTKWGFTSTGTFLEVIQDFNEIIFKPLTGMRIYIDNNELIIFDSKNNIELEEVILNYETGLLACHEIRDEKLNKVNFGDDPAYYMISGSDMGCPEPKNKPTKQIDRIKEIEFKSLMNVNLCPNSFVEINSLRNDDYDGLIGIKGRFIITDCKYKGSNYGSDFTVTCKAQETPFVGE